MRNKLRIILILAVIIGSLGLMPVGLKGDSHLYWGIYFGMSEMGFYFHKHHYPREVW